jgi:hypothetical protein
VSGWTERVAEIKAGDTVAYAKAWLKSTGQYTGDTPRARGVVKTIEPVGGLRLAVIAWDTPELPERVNVKNLIRVKDGMVMDRD